MNMYDEDCGQPEWAITRRISACSGIKGNPSIVKWLQGTIAVNLEISPWNTNLRFNNNGITTEIALICVLQNPIDNKPSLDQVMAWCHLAASHNIPQYWHRSMMPYEGFIRPQWVVGKELDMKLWKRVKVLALKSQRYRIAAKQWVMSPWCPVSELKYL